MPSDLVIALIGFAIVASITPGPNNILVLASGLNHGVLRSLPLIAGISFGFMLMLIAVGIGLGAAIRSHASIHAAAKALSVGYMLWLAWKVARSASPSGAADDGRASEPVSALAGAAFQWINPKAWAIALTATAAFTAPGAVATSLAWVSGVFVVAALVSLSAWAALGRLMQRVVDSPSRLRAFNAVMALLLVASAAPVAYDLALHL